MRSLSAVPVWFEEAEREVGKSVGNHTAVDRDDSGALVLRLWNHPIVTYNPDQSVTLRLCGYRTATTRDRLNRALGGRGNINSVRGEWSLRTFGRDALPEPIVFADEMTVHEGGAVDLR